MQGISVYLRSDRPCYYVAYTSKETGKRVCEATGYPISDPSSKLKAYAFARERSASGIAHGEHYDRQAFSVWVPDWIRGRYRGSPKTLTSYLGAWKHLAFFLHDRKINLPRLLRYQDVVDFVHWRESQIKARSKKPVSRNTALHNVKVLSRVMREAVKRGYSQGNPCIGLSDDVPADRPPSKPELTDADIAKVRAELARRSGLGRPSDWMQIAFEIALHQGCRLSATSIPMDRIDFKRGTITFHEKGSVDFTVPMHPALRPLLERLRDEGRERTCDLPRFASRNFGRVMRAIDMPHTFHSCRVSFVSRLARGNVSVQKAMALVHHGSTAVHLIYSKLRPADVEGCFEALALPRNET